MSEAPSLRGSETRAIIPADDLFVVQDAHWRKEAACLDADPESFLKSPRTNSKNQDPLNLIGRYCAECTVVADCLANAIIENEQGINVAGGLVRKDRTVLRDRYIAALATKQSLAPVIPLRRGLSTPIPPDDRELSYMKRLIRRPRRP